VALILVLLLIPFSAHATLAVSDADGIIIGPHKCRRAAWVKLYPVPRMVQVRRPDMVCARYENDRCVERRPQMQWRVKKEAPREDGANGE
jgi:hypothetical protein